MEQAYVYKWTELSTGKWYIGSRTKKNCHPNDGYICSSKIVKPLIKKNPDNWVRELLFVGNYLEAFNLECALLQTLDAKHDENSYNLHNQDMNFHGIRKECSEKNKKRLSELHKGRVSPNKGNVCPNVGISNKKRTGIKRPEHSEYMKGRTWHCVERICPYCNKIGNGGNMLRYHFDNCKFKEI
jgi:hypothetical protein